MRYIAILAAFLFSLTMVTSAAQAEETRIVDSSVVSALVLPSGGEETRSATVDLVKGRNVITIKPLPNSCNVNTIRIKAEASVPVTIAGMNITSVPTTSKLDDEINTIIAEIEALKMETASKQDDIAVWSARESTGSTLLANLRKNMMRMLAKGEALPADVADKLDFLTGDVAMCKTTIANINAEIEIIRQIFSNLTNTYPSATAKTQIVSEIGVIVELDATAAGSAEILLTYMIDKVSWQPSYQLNFRPSEDKLDVVMYANVNMMNPLNWDDIDIVLATSASNSALTPPEPSPWYMSLDESLRERGFTTVKKGGNLSESEIYDSKSDVAVSLQAGISYTIDLGGGHSLTPGWTKQFSVSRFTIPAKLSNIVISELDASVYIQALVTNTSPYPILSGTAQCSIEDMLCGFAHTQILMPGGERYFPIGIEKRVKAKRTLNVEADERGGKMRKTRTIRVELTNSAATAMELIVKERIPISNDDDVRVSGEKFSIKPYERTEDGILTWKLKLAPGEEKVLEFTYYVEYPKDSEPTEQ